MAVKRLYFTASKFILLYMMTICILGIPSLTKGKDSDKSEEKQDKTTTAAPSTPPPHPWTMFQNYTFGESKNNKSSSNTFYNYSSFNSDGSKWTTFSNPMGNGSAQYPTPNNPRSSPQFSFASVPMNSKGQTLASFFN